MKPLPDIYPVHCQAAQDPLNLNHDDLLQSLRRIQYYYG